MRLFASLTCIVQLGAAGTLKNPSDNYDLDFFELIRRLEELKLQEEKYKVASHTAVILDVPTKLKKVGEGIEVDVEKTIKDEAIARKKKDKDVKYAAYDDYYAYSLPDYSPSTDYTYNYVTAQSNDDYYFYPDDMMSYTTSQPMQTTPQPIINKPRPGPSSPGLVSAPRPPSSFNSQKPQPSSASNERHTFSDEYEYEYYDYIYIDDLGNRRKKKKKRKKNKKSKKEYDTGFQCWECLSADSYEDCLNKGHYKTCDGGSIGCNIEVRSRRFGYSGPREIEKIHMGCKQMRACVTEHKYNGVNDHNFHPQCFEEDSQWPSLLQWRHSTCRQCCSHSNCNYQWMVPGYRLDTTWEWETTDFHAPVPY